MIVTAKALGNEIIQRLNKIRGKIEVDSLAQLSSVLVEATVTWKLKRHQALFAFLIYRVTSCEYRSDISTKISVIFPLLTFCAQLFVTGQMQGLLTKEVTAGFFFYYYYSLYSVFDANLLST